MPSADEIRWRRAAAGDHAAFAEIVEAYQNKVFSYALRRCRNRSDAEDIAQEVFLQIYKALPRFRGDAALSSWIFRIAANLCVDYSRKQKHAAQPLSDLDENTLAFLWDQPDTAPAPDELLLRKEEQQRLAKALAFLSDDHREILLLREADGLSYEEIAAFCDLAMGTVRSRLARARLALREILEGMEETV